MEKEHPIHKLMDISLEHILDMIDEHHEDYKIKLK